MGKLTLTASNDHCTCAEVAGENPECKLHGIEVTISKLRTSVIVDRREDVDTIYAAADFLESLWHDVSSGRQALSEGEQT